MRKSEPWLTPTRAPSELRQRLWHSYPEFQIQLGHQSVRTTPRLGHAIDTGKPAAIVQLDQLLPGKSPQICHSAKERWDDCYALLIDLIADMQRLNL